MKRIVSSVITLALTISLFSAFADINVAAETVSTTVSGYVSATNGDIEIATQSKAPKIYVDESDYEGVIHAAGDLQSDIKAVTGVDATVVSDAADAHIIIGTIGKSAAVDALIADGSLDVSEISGEWEAFTLQNIDGKLVIAGADKRGTMYGVYDLSEKMGVSPWEWWADVTPQHSDAIYVTLPNGGFTQGAPAVKYRGIFINQEYNLWNWSKPLAGEGETGMNTATYEKIFQLMARLGANYMWPAMHEYSPAFNNNPLNAQNADKYGIAMGGSHCEMLLRNNMGELLDFQTKWIAEHPDATLYMFRDGSLGKDVAYDYTDIDKEGNAVDNKQFLEDYWRERIKTNGKYENVYTVGMRGVHDGQWNPVVPSEYTTTKEKNQYKIDLLEEIITKQREILSEEIGKDASEIPQVFIPYKEILDLYNASVDNPLSIPEDITIMWTNDNFGHIRQGSTEAEMARSGGGGMYYHVSYHGKPTDVIWTAGTQLGLIKEEMSKAYDKGANNIWILNVGPLKPFENQMEYFIDLGRNMDKLRSTSVNEYVKDNARRYFGFDDTKAQEYADIQCEYLQLANSRRPEFMQQGKFSITSYGDEMQKEADKYAALLQRSTALYNSLAEDLKPAFYELQLYAIKTANDIMDNYMGADRSVLYSSQSRGASVNKYIKQSTDGRTAIDPDTALYNTMLNGKWNNVINPWQTKEVGSWVIKIASAKAADAVTELPYTKLGVAAENQTDLTAAATLEFSGYTKDVRFIDIFNQGTGSLDWRVAADKDWVTFNKTRGTVYDDDRIYAGIDWTKAPTGSDTATITVTQYIGETAVDSRDINVTLNNTVKADIPEKTYTEANGYVSIEAEHYTSTVASGDYKWQEQDDLGRSGTSMKFVPDTAAGINDNSAYLEYNVNFETTGTFDIDVYRMPTLNERGSVNFAVGIDDAKPTVLSGTYKYTGNSDDRWGEGVLNNNESLTAQITVSETGIHKIRLYGVDTGAIVDKMVITTGTKYASYYGAPESYNTTYNTSPASMPEAKAAAVEITGEVTSLFAPTLHTVGLNLTSGEAGSKTGVVTGDKTKLLTEVQNGTGIIAVYNGNTLSEVQTSTAYSGGAYIFDKAVNPKNGETVKGMVWDSINGMTPLGGVYDAVEIGGDTVEDAYIIKLGAQSNAQITVAAYGAGGEMLGSKTVTADFTAAQINEKVTVPIDFEIPNGTKELQVIAYDSAETLNALSPAYTADFSDLLLMATYDSGKITTRSDLADYKGKEAICRITDDETGDEVYIRQETVSDDTFKAINTGTLDGTCTIKFGVSGEGIVSEEKAYTTVNITTDNEETTDALYSWNFDTDQTASSGKNVPVITGNAVYDGMHQAVKMTSANASGGAMNISFDKPVTMAQGQKITVVSKIAYGKPGSNQFMDYTITDTAGNILVKSHICFYSSAESQAQLIQVGEEAKLTSGIPAGIQVSNKKADGIQNGFSTYTTVFDPDANTITLTVSNSSGETKYQGKFPQNASYDIAAIDYSTTHKSSSQSCYVDDISITKTTAPSYTMTFDIKDSQNNAISNPDITVTDKKYNTIIEPEQDGTYKLCEGLYEYTVTADGYGTIRKEFELSPSTPSKTVSVTLPAA